MPPSSYRLHPQADALHQALGGGELRSPGAAGGAGQAPGAGSLPAEERGDPLGEWTGAHHPLEFLRPRQVSALEIGSRKGNHLIT